MNYIIYTDASCSPQDNIFASAFWIRTSTKFITLNVELYKGSDISIAETVAIGLAADTVIKELKLSKEDKVTIFTDRMDCINFYSTTRISDGFPRTKEKRAIWAWCKFRELSKMCNLSLEKIKGHRDDVNGNKIADRLVRYSLKAACQ